MNNPRVNDPNQRLLRRFLSRYNNLKKVRKRLEKRRLEIEMDFSLSPFSAIKQGDGSRPSSEPTIPPYILAVDGVLSEILRINNEASKSLIEIEHFLDLLDHDGLRYLALTLRYIDGWSEEQICEYIPCSARMYYYLISDGIDELLAFPEVKARIDNYAIEVAKISKK